MMLVHSSNKGCRQKRRPRLLKRPPIPRPPLQICRTLRRDAASPRQGLSGHRDDGLCGSEVLRGCGRGWAGWARRARALGRSSGVLAAAPEAQRLRCERVGKEARPRSTRHSSSTASGRSSNASTAAQNRTHRNDVCAN